MYSLGFSNISSRCSYWGRNRQNNQVANIYSATNQPLNNVGPSNPIYQLESMISQETPLSVAAVRQSQRSFSNCSRYMHNNSGNTDGYGRRDWQWRRYNDEALGELCSWLQATESTLSSRLPSRSETNRSSCSLRPASSEQRRPAKKEQTATKSRRESSSPKEKCKYIFVWH